MVSGNIKVILGWLAAELGCYLLNWTTTMHVRLRFERVYGTISRYGENPRESPLGSPIVLDHYPLPGERTIIHLGRPVEELYRTYQVARAGGFTLVRRNFLHEDITEADEAAALRQAQTEPLPDDLRGGTGTSRS